MDQKWIQTTPTLGLNYMDGDSVVDWDKYFKQNFQLIDTFVGNMAKYWPVMGVDGPGSLKVVAATGMTVTVQKGFAAIRGHFFKIDVDQTLTIEAADKTNMRIDRVVLRLDWATDTMKLAVLKGTPGTIVAAPMPTTNDTTYELPLAQINVDANVTSITAAKIMDERVQMFPFALAQQSPYFDATFQNAWINYGNNYETAGYMKDEFGYVNIKGMIYNGLLTKAAFVLPAGYRPTKIVRFAMQSHDGTNIVPAGVEIQPSGNVTVQYGGNTWVLLNGIRFKAEQ